MTHDNAYKLLFSEPQMVIDLLQGFVHEPWVEYLDFSTLEKMPTQCVTDDLRDREDDVIWRLKCKDEWLYVYLLIEFQSTVDYFMAVRLMTYIGLLYQDLIKQQKLGKKDKLPPVFPIVLYNGKQRWTAATELSTLIHDLPLNFNKYKPHLSYMLLDEGAYSADELNPLKNLVAAIFRLENAKTHEDIIAVVDDLLQWLIKPEQASIHRAFNIWIKRVLLASGKITEPLENINDLTEVRTMLAETIASWPKEWEAQGIEKGIEKGIKKGIEKGIEKGIKKGIEKGIEKGIKKGSTETREMMLHQERLLFKRMACKRFGESIADSVWILLQNVEKSNDLELISDWLLDCETGEEFLLCFNHFSTKH